MNKKDGGIWEKKIPALDNYASYKYAITGTDGVTVLKSDPYARHFETAPANASKLYFSDYKWRDDEWREKRRKSNIYESPVNIYELHAGSWRRFEDGNTYDYVTLARELSKYLKKMNAHGDTRSRDISLRPRATAHPMILKNSSILCMKTE